MDLFDFTSFFGLDFFKFSGPLCEDYILWLFTIFDGPELIGLIVLDCKNKLKKWLLLVPSLHNCCLGLKEDKTMFLTSFSPKLIGLIVWD